MKATGIVRRIDDLGRVVIPKEIRRTLRIREGDPLEIFTERDGEVIFKKYSPMGELSEFAAEICDSLNKATGTATVVCDRDTVIAVAGGSRRELMGKRISPELEQLMEDRRAVRPEIGERRPQIAESTQNLLLTVGAPVLAQGDVMGCILFAAPAEERCADELELKLVQTVALFLGKQLEA